MSGLNFVNAFLILGFALGFWVTEWNSAHSRFVRHLWMMGCWAGLAGAILIDWGGRTGTSHGLNSWGLMLGFLAGAMTWGLFFASFPELARGLDLLVPGMALALVSARLGCWLAGCYPATRTTLQWGASYGPSSLIYQDQLDLGWIDWTALQSLPVHPLPLYEAGAAALGLSLWFLLHRRLESRYLRPGMLLSLAIIGYVALRLTLAILWIPSQVHWAPHLGFLLGAVSYPLLCRYQPAPASARSTK